MFFFFNFLRTLLTGIREGSLTLILLCLLCLVILYLSRRDSLQTSAFNGSLTLHLSISHFSRESFIKALSGMCVRYHGLVYKFFQMNNIELNCSFVCCRKYHKSWWNGTAEHHILVDLLCGTRAAELQNSVYLLCGTRAAELQNSVDLLCGTTAAELKNSVDLLCDTTAAKLRRFILWHNGCRA